MRNIELITIDRDNVRNIMPVMESAFDPQFGEAWTLEQCQSTMLIPGAHIIAAIQDDYIIGFAYWLTIFENSELLLLAVHPQKRGQGVGRMLLNEWSDQSFNDQVKHLFLEVRETNEALRFYTLSGFEIIGKRENYYHLSDGDNLSALTMRKSL